MNEVDGINPELTINAIRQSESVVVSLRMIVADDRKNRLIRHAASQRDLATVCADEVSRIHRQLPGVLVPAPINPLHEMASAVGPHHPEAATA